MKSFQAYDVRATPCPSRSLRRTAAGLRAVWRRAEAGSAAAPAAGPRRRSRCRCAAVFRGASCGTKYALGPPRTPACRRARPCCGQCGLMGFSVSSETCCCHPPCWFHRDRAHAGTVASEGPGPSGKISTRLAGGPGGLRGGAGGQRAEVVWRRAARPGKRPAVEDTGLAVQSQTAGLGRPPHWA